MVHWVIVGLDTLTKELQSQLHWVVNYLFCIEELSIKMNKLMSTDDVDYVIAIDTDSLILIWENSSKNLILKIQLSFWTRFAKPI